MRLWVWRNFGVEVPDDWEMLQYSKRTDAGNVAFADRYRYRFELSWRVLEAAPDLERMMSDYCSKLRADGAGAGARQITSAGWPGLQSGPGVQSGPVGAGRDRPGVQSGPGGAGRDRPGVQSGPGVLSGAGAGLTTRFARFFRVESCLIEVVFVWPEGREEKLERAVLGSVRVVGERAGGLRRWKAFGMDMLVTPGLPLVEVSVAPALAAMGFSCEKGGRREERFERRGMTDQWLRKPVGDWLAARVPDGFDLESRETRDMPGHTVEAVRGTVRATGVGRLLGRRMSYGAAAWICPGDGRLYYVRSEAPAPAHRAGPASGGGASVAEGVAPGGVADGRLSCCPDLPLAK